MAISPLTRSPKFSQIDMAHGTSGGTERLSTPS
jgi:hypothetical protein